MKRIHALCLLLLCCSPLPAGANTPNAGDRREPIETLAADVLDPIAAVSSPTDAATAKSFEYLSWFSDGYYNEYYRFKAAREATKGDWTHAAKLFEIAARFGDKYSQHRLSLLYWYGVGVPKDRIEAYVFADIAAERGYPTLLAIREKMWEALTPAEQAMVPERGRSLLAKYGDETVIPIFNGMLARQRARSFSKPPERYYLKLYIARENASWSNVRVDVGEIERDAERSEESRGADTKPSEPGAKSP